MENYGFPRQKVRFHETTGTRRQPYDDEYSVMREAAKHISSCHRCIVPADQEQEMLLCRTGYLLTMDVWKYLRLEYGRVLSTTSMVTSGYKTEVEIPLKFGIITRLLSQRRATTTGYVQSPRTLSKQQNHQGDSFGSYRLTTKPKELRRTNELSHDADFVLCHATIPSVDLPLSIRRSDVKSLIVHKVLTETVRRTSTF